MNTIMLLNFFIELWNRIKAKSPRFFQVLQVFFGCLTLIGYLPGAMDRYFNVAMPDNLVNFCNDIAKYTTGFLAATFLPVRPPSPPQDEKKLPYTVNHEIKTQDGNKDNTGTT